MHFTPSDPCVIAHERQPYAAIWSLIILFIKYLKWIILNVYGSYLLKQLYLLPLIQGPSWFPTFWPSYLRACPSSFWKRLLVSTRLLEGLECGNWPLCLKVKTHFSVKRRQAMYFLCLQTFSQHLWVNSLIKNVSFFFLILFYETSHQNITLCCFRCGFGCCCSVLLAKYLLHCDHCLGSLLSVQFFHSCEYLYLCFVLRKNYSLSKFSQVVFSSW